MISERIIKKLKQTNISQDAGKTKTRVHELWKASSKAQKNAVEEAAGISRATIYRVYNTGSISAKLVVPMAQNFNVDPNFLTGRTDAQGECSDELLADFLKELGYEKLLSGEEKSRRRRRSKVSASEAAEPTEVPVLTAPSAAVSADAFTFDELSLLVQSVLLREKAGVPDAVAKAAKLRALLLS